MTQNADNKIFVDVTDNSEEAEGTDGLVPGLQGCENVVHNGTSLKKTFTCNFNIF